jgi:hypothetical protein
MQEIALIFSDHLFKVQYWLISRRDFVLAFDDSTMANLVCVVALLFAFFVRSPNKRFQRHLNDVSANNGDSTFSLFSR